MGRAKNHRMGTSAAGGHRHHSDRDRNRDRDTGSARPWFQSTPVVSLLSLIVALLALTLSQFAADMLNSPGSFLEFITSPGQSRLSYDNPGLNDGDNYDAHRAADAFQKGNMEYRNGRQHEALKYFKQAISLSPTHSFAWANLGNLQRDLGALDEAVASHHKAVELLPTRARHWYNLGVSLYTQRKLTQAIEAFRSALRLNDAMANAHYNLGIALVEVGERAEARLRYEKAVTLEAKSMVGFGARCNLCNLIANDEGLGKAIRCFQSLLEDAPRYERAMINLAASLQNLADAGQPVIDREAAFLAHLPSTCSQPPSTPNARSESQDGSGCIHTEDQQPEGPLLTTAEELREAARNLYGRVLEMNPRHPIAEHALAALTGGSAGDSTVPTAASANYVAQLFDSYSVEFDSSLAALGYQVPALLRAAVATSSPLASAALAGAGKHGSYAYGTAVDLGCGTGLAGGWMKALSRRLVGVDLSARMLEVARGRRKSTGMPNGETGMLEDVDQEDLVYDELLHLDVLDALERRHADLIVAADVLCYLGDLDALFSTVARSLNHEGDFAFTVEALLPSHEAVAEGDAPPGAPSSLPRWVLDSSGRYAHSEQYIDSLIHHHGFVVRHKDLVVARRRHAAADADPVQAHLFVLTVAQ